MMMVSDHSKVIFIFIATDCSVLSSRDKFYLLNETTLLCFFHVDNYLLKSIELLTWRFLGENCVEVHSVKFLVNQSARMSDILAPTPVVRSIRLFIASLTRDQSSFVTCILSSPRFLSQRELTLQNVVFPRLAPLVITFFLSFSLYIYIYPLCFDLNCWCLAVAVKTRINPRRRAIERK